MDRRTALARLSDVTNRQVVPFAKRLRSAMRHTADELSNKLLGADFESRTQVLRERYQKVGGDPFGLDPETAKYAVMGCSFLHRVYFRTRCHGLENLPQGRALLIANHSGQVPLDAAIIACALFLDAEPPRVTRAMVDKWTATLPFISTFFSRVGQVVGIPENARRLLEMDEVLLVFPEGVRGIGKPFAQRYQLQPFGLGFMRLAIETDTPIVPVAVIGAEEQYVNFGNLDWAARAFGLPTFPIIPQFLVPGGQLPLPTRYHLYFGEPMRFEGDVDDDDRVIGDKVWLVKQTIKDMIDRGLQQRRGLFF